jgi:hypothetical protein
MRSNSDNLTPSSARAEQAARIAAMLRRWAEEDVSDEPDWDPAEVERTDTGIGSIAKPRDS